MAVGWFDETYGVCVWKNLRNPGRGLAAPADIPMGQSTMTAFAEAPRLPQNNLKNIEPSRAQNFLQGTLQASGEHLSLL